MLCPKCGKESHNLRVCAHCQTPYSTDVSTHAGSSRNTHAGASHAAKKGNTVRREASDPRNATDRRALRARLLRRVAIGLVAVGAVAFFVMPRQGTIPVGVALPDVSAAPMSPMEAASHLKAVGEAGQVDLRAGELNVRFAATMFPERREGQAALVQQYARADEIVLGRKRVIKFLDPDGRPFARADPATGVMLTR